MTGFLTKLLFESQPLLLMAGAMAMAVALAVHRRCYTTRTRRGLWLTLGVCALLLVLQKVVVTDRERLAQLATELASAVDDGDVGAIDARLDSSFQYRNQDKLAFLTDVNERLQRWQINEASLSGLRVEIDGDRATMAFHASCDWRSGDKVEYNILSAWELQCVRRPDGWKLQRIVSAKIGPAGMLNLADVWNY